MLGEEEGVEGEGADDVEVHQPAEVARSAQHAQANALWRTLASLCLQMPAPQGQVDLWHVLWPHCTQVQWMVERIRFHAPAQQQGGGGVSGAKRHARAQQRQAVQGCQQLLEQGVPKYWDVLGLVAALYAAAEPVNIPPDFLITNTQREGWRDMLAVALEEQRARVVGAQHAITHAAQLEAAAQAERRQQQRHEAGCKNWHGRQVPPTYQSVHQCRQVGLSWCRFLLKGGLCLGVRPDEEEERMRPDEGGELSCCF